LIQVVKSKTGQGFVPNTAASINKAKHSQPPVGSKVLLEMYKKYNDTWMVELLFDDLYDWYGARFSAEIHTRGCIWPARLKLLYACDQCRSSRMFTPLTG
jgi:hypothetical protein